jgi:hypothetical protein
MSTSPFKDSASVLYWCCSSCNRCSNRGPVQAVLQLLDSGLRANVQIRQAAQEAAAVAVVEGLGQRAAAHDLDAAVACDLSTTTSSRARPGSADGVRPALGGRPTLHGGSSFVRRRNVAVGGHWIAGAVQARGLGRPAGGQALCRLHQSWRSCASEPHTMVGRADQQVGRLVTSSGGALSSLRPGPAFRMSAGGIQSLGWHRRPRSPDRWDGF